MSRRLAITKRQAKVFIEAARETGVDAEVKIGDVVVRFFPAGHSEPSIDLDKHVDEATKGYL